LFCGVLLPAFPTPLEFTRGCWAPVPACGTLSADLDSFALAPEALAVPMPLLVAALAPTPVAGPAGSVVERWAATPRSLAPGEALLVSSREQPTNAMPNPVKIKTFFTR